VVWDKAICVENASTVNSARAALCIKAGRRCWSGKRALNEADGSVEESMSFPLYLTIARS
jgi:hypothetical protein